MTIRIQKEDFDVGHEIKKISSGQTGIGAVVSFTGIVRGETEAGSLIAITLEHYPGMTDKELERIETEARTRWPLQDSLIIHRFGDLKPGDNIVLVITASKHRQAAFEAAQFLMDYLKTKAPFWKKEQTTSGKTDWVDARTSDNDALTRWTASPHKDDAAD